MRKAPTHLLNLSLSIQAMGIAWEVKVSKYVLSQPTYSDGKIFVGANAEDYPSTNAKLLAYKAKTGKPIANFHAKFISGFNEYSPMIYNGYIYVKGGSSIINPHSVSDVYCFNERNGKEIWKHQLPQWATGWTPAINSEYVAIFNASLNYHKGPALLALDRKTKIESSNTSMKIPPTRINHGWAFIEASRKDIALRASKLQVRP